MWRFLKKLEIELPYDPAIPLLGIEHFPQLLRDCPLLALLPLDGDLIKFVLAGLDLVLQLFKSANI